MILKNAQFVGQMWERFCKDSRLALIAICHAHKADNTPRGGLSNRGKEQASLMQFAITQAMHDLLDRRGLSRFYAADTKRNISTLLRIMPPSIPYDNPEQLISTPATLDIPSRDETPSASRARIKRGLIKIICQPRDARVIIYCGNSPVMNDKVVGFPGIVVELEALFLAYKDGEFLWLGQVAPEFQG